VAGTQYSAFGLIVSKLIEARRVTRNAPAGDEGDRTGGAVHVDGDGVISDAAPTAGVIDHPRMPQFSCSHSVIGM
jgi:hypothetical protein